MEHRELIAEMAYIEKLSTQERLKLAKRRRMQQLKKWTQLEKDSTIAKKDKSSSNENMKRGRGVVFVSNVMLLEAAARNDVEEVRELLQCSAVSPNATNEDGLTALHQCCIDDSADMLQLLLQYGADVNAADSEKWTPLHAAATCGHLHLARILVQHGANLLAVNADGNMPYDICEDDATLDYIECEMARRGVTQEMIDTTRTTTETAMVQELQQMKANGESLLVRDSQNATPLHIAAANGYLRVAEFLIQHNFPLELKDVDDWTPLHAAACWGHPDVLELLVQHGASLYARNKNSETPYDVCEDIELKERMLQLLSEQETKRMSDHHRRIRRGHSANTRTQSVRRTSIRDKTLTAKKEAADEARLRLTLSREDSDSQSQGSNGNGGTQININSSTPPEQEHSIDNDTNGNGMTVVGSLDAADGEHIDDKLEYHQEQNVSKHPNYHNDSSSDINKNINKDGVALSERSLNDSENSNELAESKRGAVVSGGVSGALAAAGRRRQENDYGGAFYSQVNEEVLKQQQESATVANNKTDDKADNEEIYYDDSVNSAYSNSDLVLSHFPTPPDINLLEAIERATRSRQQQQQLAARQDEMASVTLTCPSIVADSSPGIVNDNQSSPILSRESHLTNAEDSVVPLLGPQPDLIPESVRRKPPKPAKPDSLMFVARQNSNERPQRVAPLQSPSSSCQSSLSRTNGPESGVSVMRLKQQRPTPPPRTSSVKSNSSDDTPSPSIVSSDPFGVSKVPPVDSQVKPATNGVAESTNRRGPSTYGGRVKNAAPPPPIAQISVNAPSELCNTKTSDDSSTTGVSVIKKGNVCNDYVSNVAANTVSTVAVPSTSAPAPASSNIVALCSSATAGVVSNDASKQYSTNSTTAIATMNSNVDVYNSDSGSAHNTYDSRHNNGIDIHVTVTVKPLAPGTLADLKQQRALNRGSSIVDGLNLDCGEDNKAFETSSVMNDSSTNSAVNSFKPPVSPSQMPRRYHGQPSEYPSPVESRSCCVIL